jgi:hypothetical protein
MLVTVCTTLGYDAKIFSVPRARILKCDATNSNAMFYSN